MPRDALRYSRLIPFFRYSLARTNAVTLITRIMSTLDTLTEGQSATIQSFSDKFLSLKLIEMGCLPGETVKLSYVAPLGDPIAIEVSGYMLSLRKQEASTVLVNVISEN